MTVNTTFNTVITPWVQYTPTFTGFGTPSSVSFWSRRVGNQLEVRGKFTAGTGTVTEARVTIGYAGTSANVSSDASVISSIQSCGTAVISYSTQVNVSPLIESNVSYMTFGFQATGRNGLTKIDGSVMLGSGDTISLMAIIPVTTWP